MAEPIIAACLGLDDQAEQAAGFYTRIFPRGRINSVARYPDSFDNPSGKPRGSVLTAAFEIAGQPFLALNGGGHFSINPSISFFAYMATKAQLDSLFGELADGGEVLMPLSAYPWSKRYGWVKDRYGVSWQVTTQPRAGAGSSIATCLMFAGAQHGQAEAAMKTYTDIFPNSAIENVARHSKGQGLEGSVKHGRFTLAGQEMVAMDSHIDHGASFNEGLSLQVMCEDQAELDRYWSALQQGGSPGRCGWVKDRYGVSWQVVPRILVKCLTSPDAAARDRVFQAMLDMERLDITRIEAAFGKQHAKP